MKRIDILFFDASSGHCGVFDLGANFYTERQAI
jgi:hypothetical protein